MWYLIFALANGVQVYAPMPDQDTCEATLTAVTTELVKAKVREFKARCGYNILDWELK